MSNRCSSALCRMLICAAVASAADYAAAHPPSAEVAAIIEKWKSTISDPAGYEIHGDLIIYNKMYEIEIWSTLTIQYEAPRSIRLEIQPMEVPQNAAAHRQKPRSGQPYRVEPGTASLWIWTPQDLVHGSPGTGKLLDPEALEWGMHHLSLDRTPEISAVPPPPSLPEDPLPIWQLASMRGGSLYLHLTTGIDWSDSVITTTSSEPSVAPSRSSNVFSFLLIRPESMLPVLFAADAPGFDNEFDLTIQDDQGKPLRINGRRLSNLHSDGPREFSVLLDRRTGRPLAQRTVDSSGQLETVMVFRDWKPGVNIDRAQQKQRRKWDYAVYSLPPDWPILPHRHKPENGVADP